MTAISNSYLNIIEHTINYSNISKLKTYGLLKYLGLHGASYYAHGPIFYLADYTQRKYLYIDPSSEKILGSSPVLCANEKHWYFMRLWNRNDIKVYNENVFPEAIHFLKQYSVSDYPGFSFSFNYRVKTKDGENQTLLQRATYFSNSNDGNPLASIGTIVNITNYKTDSSIIHTAEKIDRDISALANVPLFKSVYYPDKADSVLSRRELEILAAIYEGLSSKQIAEKFSLSINAINNHRKNMLHKTNTNNCSQLLQYAKKNGLL